MKTIKRVSAILVVVLLCAMVLVPATAYAVDQASYTPIPAVNQTFTKNLTMDSEANIPAVTFQYTIEAGTPIAADSSNVAVFAGVVVGTGGAKKPSIANVVYAANEQAAEGVLTITTAGATKTAQKTATIDFTGVSFPEPGIYRYVITETANTDKGITNDAKTTRVLDVYVTDSNNGQNTLSAQYVFHENASEIAKGEDNGSSFTGADATALTDKSTGYTNSYSTHNLTVGKTVTGNQASRDKFFKFVVTISGAPNGTVFTVDLTNAVSSGIVANIATASEYAGQQNPAVLTTTNGTASGTFYLQHGQSIVIQGLPDKVEYSITETPEDYKNTATITGDTINGVHVEGTPDTNVALANNTVADTAITADTAVTFTNTRTGAVPTGVMMTVVPGVIIVAVALGGLFALKRKKNEA